MTRGSNGVLNIQDAISMVFKSGEMSPIIILYNYITSNFL